MDYIKHFVAKLPIGPDDFQVAVATYAYSAQLLIKFNEYTDKGNLMAAIEELEQRVYPGGPTFTYKALDWGRKVIFPAYFNKKLCCNQLQYTLFNIYRRRRKAVYCAG